MQVLERTARDARSLFELFGSCLDRLRREGHMQTDSERELLERAAAFDRCWLEGRTSDLGAFLHPEVVFTGPEFRRLAKGVEACVQSYAKFVAAGRIHDFAAGEHIVDVTADTAVMTLRWTIDYEMSGTRYVESGRELLVWVRRAGRWEIFWRNQQPEQS